MRVAASRALFGLVLRTALLSCASRAVGLLCFERPDHAIHHGNLVGVKPIWALTWSRHAATIGLSFERYCLPHGYIQLVSVLVRHIPPWAFCWHTAPVIIPLNCLDLTPFRAATIGIDKTLHARAATASRTASTFCCACS